MIVTLLSRKKHGSVLKLRLWLQHLISDVRCIPQRLLLCGYSEM